MNKALEEIRAEEGSLVNVLKQKRDAIMASIGRQGGNNEHSKTADELEQTMTLIKEMNLKQVFCDVF